MSESEGTTALRLRTLERNHDVIDSRVDTHTTDLAVQDSRIKANESQIASLTALMNKVIWSLVGLSLTIAASAAAIALTVGQGT